MKRLITNNFFISALLILAASFAVPAQITTVPPTSKPLPKPAPGVKAPVTKTIPAPTAASFERETNEKFIKVNPKVSLSLCVLEGNVKINGWDRDEIRVFIKDGSKIGFKILESNPQTKNPTWLMLLGFEPQERATSVGNECVYGEEIEIDAPRGTAVNLKGQETRTAIDSVRKVSVKNVGGNITLRNISEGIEALTYEGDVSVENSSGAITLDSANGNIIAFEVAPSEIGDIFKAKSNNGKIVLQNLSHRQLEIYSISGAINFNGAFASGGLYNFGTTNGSILLSIPKETSCKVVASYGFGGFSSELPITKITENNTPRAQKIVGTMGSGEATLNLTTSSGAIRIRSKK